MGRGPVAALVATVVTLAAAALAPAATAESAPAPGGFRLQGSHGYTLAVMASPAGFGQPSQVYVVATRKRSFAAYVAGAKVTPTSLEADLGALGRIAVAYHPTGGMREFVGMCEEHLVYPRGYYEGTIEFHGEEGFTDVATNWAFGRPLESSACGGTLVVSGTDVPGVAFSAISLKRERQFIFEAHRNGPHQPSHFRTELFEANGDVAIVRGARARGGADSFAYGRHRRDPVVIRPPRPFTGSAVFRQKRRRSFDWSGNLRIDLPGKRGVDLTDGVILANLSRHTMVFESAP